MAELEKIAAYRRAIRQLLEKYASYKPSHGDIEFQAIFDAERDRYQVFAIGWEGKERVYGCSIHLDIQEGKIWIQVNNTEWDLGQALVDLNVPKDDIVIGFHPPYLRQYSGYAVV